MRFVVPADKKLQHEMGIAIRWGDMDAMGHVNNTVYFRYFETVRLAWVGSLGVGTRAEGSGPLIINAFCNFLRQLEYPGEVLARFYTANPGRTSFDSWVTLERSDEAGVIYAEGGSKMVWTDYQARKSVPVPDWVRQRLL